MPRPQDKPTQLRSEVWFPAKYGRGLLHKQMCKEQTSLCSRNRIRPGVSQQWVRCTRRSFAPTGWTQPSCTPCAFCSRRDLCIIRSGQAQRSGEACTAGAEAAAPNADSQARSPTAQPVAGSTAGSASPSRVSGREPAKQDSRDVTHGLGDDHGYVARSFWPSTPSRPGGCGSAARAQTQPARLALRERETPKAQRKRQTDRQTDRQAGRQAGRRTDGQADGRTGRRRQKGWAWGSHL